MVPATRRDTKRYDLIADAQQTHPIILIQVHNDTKAIILTAYIKMSNTYPELKDSAQDVFDKHRNYIDCELQQRGRTYPAPLLPRLLATFACLSLASLLPFSLSLSLASLFPLSLSLSCLSVPQKLKKLQ
jgi:hypothetical protein